MNANEQKLIVEMRRTAASHRMDGKRKTADLLERGANKIERLLKPYEIPAGKHEYVDCPKGVGCLDCAGEIPEDWEIHDTQPLGASRVHRARRIGEELHCWDCQAVWKSPSATRASVDTPGETK